MRKSKFIALMSLSCALVLLGIGPEKSDPAEAARLNNLGLAYMNQQLFEKALREFQQAEALDLNLKMARLNQGIALLNLGKVDAAKPILEDGVKNNPNDPHAWYNLGLLDKNSDNPQSAVDAFRRVTEIDPNDADTWYFLGAAYAQVKQFPQAIDAFQHALKLNPLHASAQFGLSRAYQQSGDLASAREHLVRFQYVTQHKLGAAISLAYGEQGKYSLAEESPLAAEKVPPSRSRCSLWMSRERAGLVGRSAPQDASVAGAVFGPGACFLDYDGDGKPDIFVADNGPQVDSALYHNLGDGKFEDVTEKAGLDPLGTLSVVPQAITTTMVLRILW